MMNDIQKILHRDEDAILREFRADDLRGEERKQVLNALLEHFEKVITETVILNLDPAGRDKLSQALSEEGNLDQKISELTASLPGIAEKIEAAVSREFRLLKLAQERAK